MNLYHRIVTLAEQLCTAWPRLYVLACLLVMSGLGYLSVSLGALTKDAFELITAFHGQESLIVLAAMLLLLLGSLFCAFLLVTCLLSAYTTLRHLYAQHTEVGNDV
jgi:hypothetical protein